MRLGLMMMRVGLLVCFSRFPSLGLKGGKISGVLMKICSDDGTGKNFGKDETESNDYLYGGGK
jgi:hypothetical protein